jgi:hypothetical protein
MRRAFVYDWRLWTLPEVLKLLEEAGFRESRAYVDTGDGVYHQRRSFMNQPGWLAIIAGSSNALLGIVGQDTRRAHVARDARLRPHPERLPVRGPVGRRQDAHRARPLAAALVCRTGSDEACGVCDACLRVSRFQHPDVRFLSRS